MCVNQVCMMIFNVHVQCAKLEFNTDVVNCTASISRSQMIKFKFSIEVMLQRIADIELQ